MSLEQAKALTDALEVASSAFGLSAVVIASSWRPGAQVNLDDAAAVALKEVLTRAGWPEQVCLILVGQGGTVGFADAAVRLLQGSIKATYLSELTSGALSLLSLSSPQLTLLRGAGLGAYDAGRLGAQRGQWSHELLAHWPDAALLSYLEPERRAQVGLSLAAQGHERVMAQQLALGLLAGKDARALEALSISTLGRSRGLGVGALGALGFDAKHATAEAIAALGPAIAEIEALLSLGRPMAPRYTQSELIDEVEFELATTTPGALIACAKCAMILELDTGRPDPDSGLLDGQWIDASLF